MLKWPLLAVRYTIAFILLAPCVLIAGPVVWLLDWVFYIERE